MRITQPKEGEQTKAGSVQVAITVSNFSLVNKMGDPPKEGEGHVHYYLDVDEIPTKADEEATVSGEGRYVATPSKSYIWTNVPPGKHRFGVQLVKNNHRPLQPPASDEVEITVEG